MAFLPTYEKPRFPKNTRTKSYIESAVEVWLTNIWMHGRDSLYCEDSKGLQSLKGPMPSRERQVRDDMVMGGAEMERKENLWRVSQFPNITRAYKRDSPQWGSFRRWSGKQSVIAAFSSSHPPFSSSTPSSSTSPSILGHQPLRRRSPTS
jgi:hypothetical protein